MTVSTADAQRAADRWEEIRITLVGPAHLPGSTARMVIAEDLLAAHLLHRGDPLQERMYQAICSEFLPRCGDQMDSWGAAEWLPVLARARELSGGATDAR